LALISGRSLSNLDQLFSPLRLCASGTHGCERRDTNGALTVPAIDAARLAAVRAELHHFVDRHPGLILEDKHYGLAMHFRRAPQFGVPVQNKMRAMLESLGPDFMLQAGKCVVELRPAAWNKGVSVTTFMQEHPFRNRTPIYIGDDVTDEDAFAAVNAMRGLSIRVGDAIDSHARHRLRGVDEVIRWLQVNPPAPFACTGPRP
jgi:trehalose 6-phosphate phosphatase